MAGGGKTATSTSQVKIPPEVLARYNAVNAQAQQVSQQPFHPYSMDPNAFVAPLTPTQQMGIYNTNVAAGMAQPYYEQAGQAMQAGLAGAAPMAYAGAMPVMPGQLGGQQIGQYMSPFLGSVVGTTMAAQAQQNAQQRAAMQGQAIQQGAFGGDRAGIAQANLAYQQNLANSQTLANLMNQGYGQALTTAQQQQQLGLSAEQANRAALQQQAQNLYGMYGGYGQALAGLGTGAQQAALQGAQAQLAAGQAQQQTGQAGLAAMYNQFQQQQSYPFQVAQFLANIAMGTGALSGSTTTTTQPAPFFSDRRLKHDVHRIGKTNDGLPIYSFKYNGDDRTQIGLMAQDVEKKHPKAVGLAGGYKTVDYEKATKGAHKSYGGGLSSMGGAVGLEHAGLGFERGGYAPGGGLGGGLVTPEEARNFLQAQREAYKNLPYADMGFNIQGTPHGGIKGRVPSGFIPQASLVTSKQQVKPQPTGMQQLQQAANGVGDIEKLWGAGEKVYGAGEKVAQGLGNISEGYNWSGTPGEKRLDDLTQQASRNVGTGMAGRYRGGLVRARADGGEVDREKDLETVPDKEAYGEIFSGGLDIPTGNGSQPKGLSPAQPAPFTSPNALQDIASIGKTIALFANRGGAIPRHGYATDGSVTDDDIAPWGEDRPNVFRTAGEEFRATRGIPQGLRPAERPDARISGAYDQYQEATAPAPTGLSAGAPQPAPEFRGEAAGMTPPLGQRAEGLAAGVSERPSEPVRSLSDASLASYLQMFKDHGQVLGPYFGQKPAAAPFTPVEGGPAVGRDELISEWQRRMPYREAAGTRGDRAAAWTPQQYQTAVRGKENLLPGVAQEPWPGENTPAGGLAPPTVQAAAAQSVAPSGTAAAQPPAAPPADGAKAAAAPAGGAEATAGAAQPPAVVGVTESRAQPIVTPIAPGAARPGPRRENVPQGLLTGETAYDAQIRGRESRDNPNRGYHYPVDPKTGKRLSTAYGAYGITERAYRSIQNADPYFKDRPITSLSLEDQTKANQVYTNINSQDLQKRGIDPTPANLSAAHFLGTKGLSDYLQNGYISPEAAEANGGVEAVRREVDSRLRGEEPPVRGGVLGPRSGGLGEVVNRAATSGTPEANALDEAARRRGVAGVAPDATPQERGSWMQRNREWVLPLLQFLGGMASSQSRYFLGAALSGLTGAAQGMVGAERLGQEQQKIDISQQNALVSQNASLQNVLSVLRENHSIAIRQRNFDLANNYAQQINNITDMMSANLRKIETITGSAPPPVAGSPSISLLPGASAAGSTEPSTAPGAAPVQPSVVGAPSESPATPAATAPGVATPQAVPADPAQKAMQAAYPEAVLESDPRAQNAPLIITSAGRLMPNPRVEARLWDQVADNWNIKKLQADRETPGLSRQDMDWFDNQIKEAKNELNTTGRLPGKNQQFVEFPAFAAMQRAQKSEADNAPFLGRVAAEQSALDQRLVDLQHMAEQFRSLQPGAITKFVVEVSKYANAFLPAGEQINLRGINDATAADTLQKLIATLQNPSSGMTDLGKQLEGMKVARPDMQAGAARNVLSYMIGQTQYNYDKNNFVSRILRSNMSIPQSVVEDQFRGEPGRNMNDYIARAYAENPVRGQRIDANARPGYQYILEANDASERFGKPYKTPVVVRIDSIKNGTPMISRVSGGE